MMSVDTLTMAAVEGVGVLIAAAAVAPQAPEDDGEEGEEDQGVLIQ